MENNKEDKETIVEISPCIPIFDRTEIKKGVELGEGAFCAVYVIRDIILSKYDFKSTSFDGADGKINQDARVLFEKEFHKTAGTPPAGSDGQSTVDYFNQSSKYVMKILQPHGMNARERQQGVKDLETELLLLLKIKESSPDENSSRGHKNIVDIKGVGGKPIIDLEKYKFFENERNFLMDRFLILERLTETMNKRLFQWNHDDEYYFVHGGGNAPSARSRGSMISSIKKSLLSVRKSMSSSYTLHKENTKLLKFWIRRFVYLEEVASAISFLHQNEIIYRDLKPQNVGFDSMDVAKIFDFGLSRTLDPSCRVDIDAESQDNSVDDAKMKKNQSILYKMTGMTGPLRYMAPEILQCKPYGKKSDVFSFSLLMHEILSLETPFDNFEGTHKDLIHSVCEKGTRPLGVKHPQIQKHLELLNLVRNDMQKDEKEKKTKKRQYKPSVSLGKMLENMWNMDYEKRPTSTDVEANIGSIIQDIRVQLRFMEKEEKKLMNNSEDGCGSEISRRLSNRFAKTKVFNMKKIH